VTPDHTQAGFGAKFVIRINRMVNASELKDGVYCNRAWLLNQQGFRITDKAVEERQAGVAFHEERAEAAARGSNQRVLWWALLLGLLGGMLLLLRALSEGRH
jgi:hypothetical protein